MTEDISNFQKGSKEGKKRKSSEGQDIVKKKKSKTQQKKVLETDESDQQLEREVEQNEGKVCDDNETKKGPSKRQLKKEKAEQRIAEIKQNKRDETAKLCLNYVSKWKHAKNEWKFEKLKQVWLMSNLLDEKCVPDEYFPTALEYFEGSKGKCRKMLIEKGMEAIKKLEENINEDSDVVENTQYQRARQLIQSLPIE